MRLLGLDIGGTSVRAVLCDQSGRLLGYGRASGANVRSATGSPQHNVAAAVAAAVGQTHVDAVGVGSAGTGAGSIQLTRAMLHHALDGRGLGGFELVSDLEIAYRSVANCPDGVLLLAGTGAAAVRLAAWRTVQRCDGMGWLLGDEGSGAWLGMRVLQAVAADLDSRGPATALTYLVSSQLNLAGDRRQALIAATVGMRPATWAQFARLAVDLDGADAVASELVAAGAERLLNTVRAVGLSATDTLVLAGGLLGQTSQATNPLRARIEAALDVAGSRFADFPVVGACALAAAQLGADLDRGALTTALRTRAH